MKRHKLSYKNFPLKPGIVESYDETQSAVNPRTEIPMRDTQDTKSLITTRPACHTVHVNGQE